MYVGLVHVAIAHQQVEKIEDAEHKGTTDYQPDVITQVLGWIGDVFSLRSYGSGSG